MIQPKDIRIGIFLQWKNSEIKNNYFTVKSIQCDYDWFEDAEPIQITEEWALKFGFKENSPISSREYILSSDGFDIVKLINHYKDGWLLQFYYWNAGIMVEHVHRLQNIVFALTEKELILNSEHLV